MSTRYAGRWPVNYSRAVTPAEYKCGCCGATGVKLWRSYNTVLEQQALKCRACAQVEQKRTHDWNEGDAIGWLVPAVPTVKGDTFWGYSSVPQAGCRWWHQLEPRSTSERHAEYLLDAAAYLLHLWEQYRKTLSWRTDYGRQVMYQAFLGEALRLGFIGRTRSGSYRIGGKTYRTKAAAISAAERRSLSPPAHGWQGLLDEIGARKG